MAWGGPEEREAERAAGNLNVKNWHDMALKIVEDTMQAFWKERPELGTWPKSVGTSEKGCHANTLASEYNQHCHMLIKKLSLGWSAELCLYLSEIAEDITRDTDIIAWWAKHSLIYPTLSLMACDICGIPASSVPCKHLFSAGGEIAMDQRSHLGLDRFEQLQILKHRWRNMIVDHAIINSSQLEEHYLQNFEELYLVDEEFTALDHGLEVV
ncbi:hypothetical protein SCLCIDRAFT_132569 [Scleroderma citrinum Foug A]|uniref:HAT C-terminal dimerisation domain-containing protein n=1 Tax=Scleroderma citrinum Foug A TaxID=1036808 RepID=A0A0C3D6N9_9AGAM|nr:hypothetical protein SCLCIDRAFT_132569 [Scleroderma citrinum Foug A]